MASKLAAFWNHPAGPKTIFFWAPTFKWCISLANIADFKRPAEDVSLPQQLAVTATGLIWMRYVWLGACIHAVRRALGVSHPSLTLISLVVH